MEKDNNKNNEKTVNEQLKDRFKEVEKIVMCEELLSFLYKKLI